MLRWCMNRIHDTWDVKIPFWNSRIVSSLDISNLICVIRRSLISKPCLIDEAHSAIEIQDYVAYVSIGIATWGKVPVNIISQRVVCMIINVSSFLNSWTEIVFNRKISVSTITREGSLRNSWNITSLIGIINDDCYSFQLFICFIIYLLRIDNRWDTELGTNSSTAAWYRIDTNIGCCINPKPCISSWNIVT